MEKIQKYRWIKPPVIPEEISVALNEFPPIIRQILFSRGISSSSAANDFFAAEAPIHDPYLLSDLDKGVRRIEQAFLENEQIAIYGDFDADGICATALLKKALELLDVKSIPYIPDRVDEGYGLNRDAIKYLASLGIKLIITVDCGIRSHVEVILARELGMDVIITDHHFPRDNIPNAYAVICPKRQNDIYPNKEISGVGIAYKLAGALLLQYGISYKEIEKLLALVALGTVADVVPLTDENRVLVRQGISEIRKAENLGLNALADCSGIDITKTNAQRIGYVIGPRLNAAGRVADPFISLNLLLANDQELAYQNAQELNSLNRVRQEKTKETQKAALEAINIEDQSYLLFVADENFEEGIVGLAASRLKEEFYRPSIVGVLKDGMLRASCRSIPEFHITKALDSCAELLLQHGGHALAAGFTASLENYDLLYAKLKKLAKMQLSSKELAPELKADAALSLSEIHPRIIPYLDLFEPTGSGNPQPLFFSEGVNIRNKRKIGKDGNHLKLILSVGKITYDANAFRKGHLYDNLSDKVNIAFYYEKNEFNGIDQLQLNIVDIKNG